MCYCRPVADRADGRACIDRVSVCSFGGAISSRNWHTCVELVTFRTLNEGLKAFRANLMYKNRPCRIRNRLGCVVAGLNTFPRRHLACSRIQDLCFGVYSIRRHPDGCLHRAGVKSTMNILHNFKLLSSAPFTQPRGFRF